MEVINATDHVCNRTSPLCPHSFYNFTNTAETEKVEGSQSRFLGVILGMDPFSLLHKVQHRNSTVEINRYRAEVNVKNVVEMIAFLHVLKIIWEKDHFPCFYMGQPLDPSKFQKFAQKIEVEHKKKMANVLWSTLMPQYYVNNANAASDAYLRKYLMQNWKHFGKLGKMIMKNGWYFPDTWKGYEQFKKKDEFSDKITDITSLTQMKQFRQ